MGPGGQAAARGSRGCVRRCRRRHTGLGHGGTSRDPLPPVPCRCRCRSLCGDNPFPCQVAVLPFMAGLCVSLCQCEPQDADDKLFIWSTSETASHHRLPSFSQHAAPATPSRLWRYHQKRCRCASLALPSHAAVIPCSNKASESYTTSVMGTAPRLSHAPPQESCMGAETPARISPSMLSFSCFSLQY